MKFRIDRQKTKLLLKVLLAAVLLLIGSWLISRLWEEEPPPAEDPGGLGVAEIEWNGKTYYENRDLDVWLVMGIDKTQDTAISFGGSNNQQNDFNMLCVLNRKTGHYAIMPINRDTMVEVNQLDATGEVFLTFVGQFALAHSFGDGGLRSCRNAVDSIEDLLFGIKVDHYLALTMEAVPVINDAVGGVTLTLEDDLTVLDPGWTKGRTVTLMGEDALVFVRARSELADGTNLARMNRQQQYILALQDALKEAAAGDDSFALSLFKSVSKQITTDTVITSLSDLVDNLMESEFDGLVPIPGEAILNPETDHTEFWADQEGLKETVVGLFCQ